MSFRYSENQRPESRFIDRFLNPGNSGTTSESNHFYGRGEFLPIPHHSQQLVWRARPFQEGEGSGIVAYTELCWRQDLVASNQIAASFHVTNKTLRVPRLIIRDTLVHSSLNMAGGLDVFIEEASASLRYQSLKEEQKRAVKAFVEEIAGLARQTSQQPPQPNGAGIDADTVSMLQSISMTLSDVQMQLSTIQEQNARRDVTLRQLEKDIQDIKCGKRAGDDLTETPKSKRSRKSPRGLSACVRKVHMSLEDDEQYRGDERVNSPHNQGVTDKLVKDVSEAGEYLDKDSIAYAAKKHHEYIVRQQKPISEEQKEINARNSRILQRRQRLFDRRIKLARGREVGIMQSLGEKYMSDEESDTEDPQALIKRSPTWRSEKLGLLLQKLDERYARSREKKDNSKPLKVRKVGPSSQRSSPANAPHWAVEMTGHSLDSSPNSSLLSSPSTPSDIPLPSTSSTPTTSGTLTSRSLPLSTPVSPIQDDTIGSDSDPEFDTWISGVTGVRA